MYKAGVSGEVSPPQTLVAMMTAFNLFNGAIHTVLANGEKLATDVRETHYS